MLLPISVLHVAFVRDIVPMDAVQAIVPRRVWVRKSGGPPAAGGAAAADGEQDIPFKYLCCRARLPRDLIFVDDGEGEDAGGG